MKYSIEHVIEETVMRSDKIVLGQTAARHIVMNFVHIYPNQPEMCLLKGKLNCFNKKKNAIHVILACFSDFRGTNEDAYLST